MAIQTLGSSLNARNYGISRAARLFVPRPTGDEVSDFIAVRNFFDAAPNNAVIEFPSGAEYTLWAGAYRVRPGQVILQNNALITQADEVTTTTTTALGDGTTTIGVTSTEGLYAGQYVAIYGTKSGGNTVIVWNYPRILSVGTNSITLSSAITLTLNVTTGSYEVGATVVQTGATLITRGTLLDAASLVDGGKCSIERVNINGNMANNDTNNRWEYDCGIKFYSSGTLSEVYLEDMCGEGIITWGQNPKLDNIVMDTLNGNGVHFNDQSYDPYLNNVKISTVNQNTAIGHADGAIIASNGTYRAQVEQFRVVSGKRAVIGSWDSNDNAFAKISKGYGEGCYIGLSAYTSAYDVEGIEITDVELYNCGPSYLGTLRTGTTENKSAKRWKIKATFRDSVVYLTGLKDSQVDIVAEFGDSATATSTTTAAGYADNYTGAALSALAGIVQIASCEHTVFNVTVRDGGAPTNKAAIYAASSTSGTCTGNTYNLTSYGNYDGISLAGNHINCKGTLKARSWAGGRTGVNINLAVQTVNAVILSGWDKPRNNAFVVDTYLDDSSVTSTFHVKANNAGTADGWLKISGTVHSKATTTATCYGVAAQNTPKKTILEDLEIIGVSGGNFYPLFTATAANANEGRVNRVRCYPAAAALGTNWLAEDTVSPMTLPA